MEDLTQCVDDVIFFYVQLAQTIFFSGQENIKFMSLSSYVLLIIFMDSKYRYGWYEIGRLGLPQLITNYLALVLLIMRYSILLIGNKL